MILAMLKGGISGIAAYKHRRGSRQHMKNRIDDNSSNNGVCGPNLVIWRTIINQSFAASTWLAMRGLAQAPESLL